MRHKRRPIHTGSPFAIGRLLRQRPYCHHDFGDDHLLSIIDHKRGEILDLLENVFGGGLAGNPVNQARWAAGLDLRLRFLQTPTDLTELPLLQLYVEQRTAIVTLQQGRFLKAGIVSVDIIAHSNGI